MIFNRNNLRAVIVVAASLFSALTGNPAVASGGSYGGPISAPEGNPQQDLTKAIEFINAEKYERAITLLKRVDRQVPQNADVLNYLGYSYRKSGDQERGLLYYQKALRINPTHPGANEYLGELYLEMNDLPKAQERLDVLASSCNDCTELHTLQNSIDAYKAAHPNI